MTTLGFPRKNFGFHRPSGPPAPPRLALRLHNPAAPGRRTHRRWVVFLAMVVLAANLAVFAPAAASAAPVTVTFEIFSVFQVENPDGDGTDGDYFPEVFIGGVKHSAPRVEDDDFAVDWVFTQAVEPRADRTVQIDVWLTDYDSAFAGDDDIMDISPNDRDVVLNVIFNVDTGFWSSDAKANNGISEGDGDHGFPEPNDGRIARILFGVSTGNNDLDGDGIPNMVERFGIRRPDTGDVIYADGMDPCRKTILLQLDYMAGAADGHSHAPKAAAKQEVVDAFDDAPVDAVNPCPGFGGPPRPQGIDFIFLPGKPIAERPVMAFDDAYRQARTLNFNAYLRPYAHYGIMVHDQKAGSSSSGLCCEPEQARKDILISLGSWRQACIVPGPDGTLESTRTGDDVVDGTSINIGPNRVCDSPTAATDRNALGRGTANASVGTVRDQSGTIMHELGHALGLGHGGDEKTNNKPNYLSVMNYSFDPDGITTNGSGGSRLDYSRNDHADLIKSSLVETDGISNDPAHTDFTRWLDGSGQVKWGRGNGDLNWNGNTTAAGLDLIDPSPVSVDINADDDATPRTTVLTGHDDWQALKYRAVAAEPGAGAAAVHSSEEIAFPVVLTRAHAQAAFFDPDVAATKSVDKADAEPGDTLGYRVEVRNVGTGTATAVALTDTFPDGNATTRSMPDIAPGRSATENFTYAIPCNTPDGTALSNRASVTATNVGDGREANTANNGSSATTTVHAPKLTLTELATPEVAAGDAITTRLVISNVGSGTATSVTVTDTLPSDVYYSTALDLGAGPRPTSVVRNPDGTTTLTWSLADLDGATSTTIEFTSRPSLLFVGGSTLIDSATVSFTNAHGCAYAPVTASATTTVVERPPTRDPLSAGYWKTHPVDQTAELRARIQATDQRFDGADGSTPDGQLSSAEALAVFQAFGSQPDPLRNQELAVLFNLASRRINASTVIAGTLADRLGTHTVGDAVRYAIATLALPLSRETADRYSDATVLLDRIANNKVEVY